MNISLDTATYYKYVARFDAMSIRERILIAVAALAVLLIIWNALMMQPLNNRQKAMQVELDEISDNMSRTAAAMEAAMEPRNTALAQLKTTRSDLDEVDHQLSTTIAGMIPPERMAAVIQDVLRQQHGLTLISLRNQPVMPLITTPDTPAPETVTDPDAPPDAPAPPPTNPIPSVKTGPYVHPLQVIVEGSYMDIVAYLKALETMQWHVYWIRLELQTKQYPANRVQIEMSTLSLDDTWLGV